MLSRKTTQLNGILRSVVHASSIFLSSSFRRQIARKAHVLNVLDVLR
jgi:hypothetical protein